MILKIIIISINLITIKICIKANIDLTWIYTEKTGMIEHEMKNSILQLKTNI